VAITQTYLYLRRLLQPSPMALEVIPTTCCRVYARTALAASTRLILYSQSRICEIGTTEVTRQSRPRSAGAALLVRKTTSNNRIVLLMKSWSIQINRVQE
jgi:hypothetical protein